MMTRIDRRHARHTAKARLRAISRVDIALMANAANIDDLIDDPPLRRRSTKPQVTI